MIDVMASAKREVLRLVTEVGGHFLDSSLDRIELKASAETPPGLIWEASRCHTVIVNFHSDRPAGWKAILRDLREGVDSCDLEDCDMCIEPDEHPCGFGTCMICYP